MQTQPQKRKLILFSLVLMLASLACLCTSGITDLIESNIPDEVTVIEEPLPTPEISDPIEAPEEEPQDSGTSPENSISSSSADLNIIDTNYYEDDFGTFNFLILVENTGSVAYEFVDATVTLKDSAGGIVASESFPSSISLVQPGTRTPIGVSWFDGVPEWESFEVFVDGQEAPEDFTFYYSDLEITSSDIVQDDFGDDVVAGEVQNTGDRATDFVIIVAIYYDADGGIIGEDFTFADEDILQPGDTSAFSFFFLEAGGEVASYDLIAEGSEVSE